MRFVGSGPITVDEFGPRRDLHVPSYGPRGIMTLRWNGERWTKSDETANYAESFRAAVQANIDEARRAGFIVPAVDDAMIAAHCSAVSVVVVTELEAKR